MSIKTLENLLKLTNKTKIKKVVLSIKTNYLFNFGYFPIV